MSNDVIGIDFGTSSSVVATFVDDIVDVLENDVNKRCTPSCAIVPDGASVDQWIFGESALRESIVFPERTFHCVKQSLDNATKDNSAEVEQITGNILRNLIATTITACGASTRAAICVPPYFQQSGRQALLRAVSHTSIKEIVLVSEVIAPLALYATMPTNNETVVVLNAGAGGTSVGVATIQNNEVNILEISEKRLPGGEMFNDRMMTYIKERIFSATQLAVTNIQDNVILRNLWESAKQKLSRIPQTSVTTFLPGLKQEVNEQITRTEFDTTCRDLFDMIVAEVISTVEKANVSIKNIDALLLVGGSARIPYLRSALKNSFASKVKLFYPEEAVAKGLVLIAANVVKVTQTDLQDSSWYSGQPLYSALQQCADYSGASNCDSDLSHKDSSRGVDGEADSDTDDNGAEGNGTLPVISNSPPAGDSALPKDNETQGEVPDVTLPNHQPMTADDSDKEEFASDKKRQFALDLNEVLRFKRDKEYPARFTGKGKSGKGEKANFRRQCLPYSFDPVDKKLYYQKTSRKNKITQESDLRGRREVILDEREQARLIKFFHEGPGNSVEANAMSSHRGRDGLVAKLQQKYFWQNMYLQAERFCQLCIVCKTVNPSALKLSDPMQPVGVPTRHMAQVGVDLTEMPEVDGNRYIIVAVDYFTKWVEAEAIPDKSSGSVARFLYKDVLCRHSCPETIITDQGREFCNKLNKQLIELCGGNHRVTSAYHPQANGLVERINRCIKNAIIKILQTQIEKWPTVLPGVLFCIRTVVQRSTKFPPFFLLYGRQPRFPAELTKPDNPDCESDGSDPDEEGLEWELRNEDDDDDDCTAEEVFNLEDLKKILRPMDILRESIDKAVEENIKKAQAAQKRAYDKRHSSGQVLTIGQEVFRVNKRQQSRQGGKTEAPKIGPYTVVEISESKTVTLKDSKGCILKNKYPICDLIPVDIPDPHLPKRMPRPKDDTDEEKLPPIETSPPEKGTSEDNIIDISSGDEDQAPKKPKFSRPRLLTVKELDDLKDLPDETHLLESRHFTFSVDELKILSSTRWLNDEIINAYLSTVCAHRSAQGLSCCFLNSFFYPQFCLSTDNAAKFVKNLDVFEPDFLLIPIHIDKVHWALCVVNNKTSTITYYDSSHYKGNTHLDRINEFLKLEFQKKHATQHIAYNNVEDENISLQENNYDCGVYACFYARRVTEGKQCIISPEQISKMRLQIGQEILAARLLADHFLQEKPAKQEKTESTGTSTITPGRGLQNLGNTCYLNSSIQALFHIPPFAEWLQKQDSHKAKCKSKYCVTCALQQVFTESKEKNTDPVVPSHFLACVQAFWKDFAEGEVQDAEEFLSVLLQQLEKEHARVPLDLPSPTTDFQIQYRTTTTCGKCGRKFISSQSGIEIMFSLEDKEVKSLQKGLKQFVATETLNDYKCGSCKATVTAEKRLHIEFPPTILMLHVRRYTANGTKIGRLLSTPNHLDIKPYLADKALYNGSTMYEFIGAITHLGPHLDGGHYTSGMKCASTFYQFDDTNVTKISRERLQTERSYMLFYKRVD